MMDEDFSSDAVTDSGSGAGGSFRGLFQYEAGKVEPWSAFNILALTVCMSIGVLLAICCLYIRHR